jgi:hypothetical protein
MMHGRRREPRHETHSHATVRARAHADKRSLDDAVQVDAVDPLQIVGDLLRRRIPPPVQEELFGFLDVGVLGIRIVPKDL